MAVFKVFVPVVVIVAIPRLNNRKQKGCIRATGGCSSMYNDRGKHSCERIVDKNNNNNNNIRYCH